MEQQNGSMRDVMAYFEMPTATFSKEWRELSDKDKADLKNGIGVKGTGTLTY